MKYMPTRDITGHCEGDCKNLVREGEEKRQLEINTEEYSAGPTKNVPWASHRTEQPGFYGGHV